MTATSLAYGSSHEFGSLTDELLRDRLVIGPIKRGTKEKRLRETSIIKQDFIDVFEGLGYIGCSNFVVDPSVVPV